MVTTGRIPPGNSCGSLSTMSLYPLRWFYSCGSYGSLGSLQLIQCFGCKKAIDYYIGKLSQRSCSLALRAFGTLRRFHPKPDFIPAPGEVSFKTVCKIISMKIQVCVIFTFISAVAGRIRIARRDVVRTVLSQDGRKDLGCISHPLRDKKPIGKIT